VQQVERQSFFHTRLARILAFVGIVWAVAGSFIASKLLFGEFVDLVTERERVALSRQRESKTCAAESTDGTAAAATTSSAGVRADTLAMGLRVGLLAVMKMSVEPGLLEDAQSRWLRESRYRALMLGVPPPAPFVPQHHATALGEFVDFVETNSSETARALALKHSREVCHLYKLGAYWGYAMRARQAQPGIENVFALQIRYHAEHAGVPAYLWEAFVAPTPRSASPQEISAATDALTENLTRYLRGQ
jgi:hypothetical protein